MIRRKGLNNDPSLRLPPPRSARHLAQELKGSFRRPEVGKIQREICQEDTHQRDPGNVMTFGDHLGPHENLDLAPFPLPQQFLMSSPLPRRIPIHPGDSGFREERGQFLFHPLGAKSHGRKGAVAAVGAVFLHRFAEAAVVAENAALFEVIGETDTAVWAPEEVPTETALEETGETPAVEEDEGFAVQGCGFP